MPIQEFQINSFEFLIHKIAAKRQVRGGQESPEMGVCCLSNRLTMFDSAIESLTHVDSNALFRF